MNLLQNCGNTFVDVKQGTDAINVVDDGRLYPEECLLKKATLLIKVSWIHWRIDQASARSAAVCEGRIYAGSVTVDLTDLVIEARAIFGRAHSMALKIGQDLSVNDKEGGVQY